jgi:hypothetical protein
MDQGVRFPRFDARFREPQCRLPGMSVGWVSPGEGWDSMYSEGFTAVGSRTSSALAKPDGVGRAEEDELVELVIKAAEGDWMGGAILDVGGGAILDVGSSCLFLIFISTSMSDDNSGTRYTLVPISLSFNLIPSPK